jgi:hypothetical protein
MMENHKILQSLEKQRDSLYKKLSKESVSGLYKKEYKRIKSGRLFVFDGEERQLLTELKQLSGNTSYDKAYTNKLNDYLKLDNQLLTDYFQKEFERIIKDITAFNGYSEIQSLFIEYDYYYHYTSCIKCYGIQDYPLVIEPRYITDEYDQDKKILLLENGINFTPAWLNCEEFNELDYLDVNSGLESLFTLHSRVLLHKVLNQLAENNNLDIFKNKPFTFYINEHESEVMMLYRLN